MTNIGIVGAGVAGLQLGLFLRHHGIQATIYTEKSATEQLGSRLPALVARVGHTRDRESQLGVNYWDRANNEISQVHFNVGGEQPLAFVGGEIIRKPPGNRRREECGGMEERQYERRPFSIESRCVYGFPLRYSSICGTLVLYEGTKPARVDTVTMYLEN